MLTKEQIKKLKHVRKLLLEINGELHSGALTNMLGMFNVYMRKERAE